MSTSESTARELEELRAENELLRRRAEAAEQALQDQATRVEAATPHEQEVDRERRKLATVLDALPVGVWIADASGRFVQSNPAAVRIWGGDAPPAEDPSQYGVYQGFWPTTGAQLAAEDWSLARTLATGETILAELVDIARFDGTRGHVLGSSAPILDEEGRTIGGVAVAIDVSDRHAADRERERLIESLEFERGRLGALLERAPAFIAVLRGEQHVLEYVNEAFRMFTGGRDVVGQPLTQAIPEAVSQGYVDLIDSVLRTGKPIVASGRPIRLQRTPDGPLELRYIDYAYQPMTEADGTRSGVFIHGFDVTEVTLQQQRVRAQFHGVPVPTSVWQRIERDGVRTFELVDYNKAALDDSSGSIAARLGESAGTYFANLPDVVTDIERCLTEGTTIQHERDQVVPGTSEKRRFCVTYAPAPPDLVLVHAEDITTRIRLEEQLRQAQKMEAIGRLAGGVAHDFNNLMAVILTYADLASADLDRNESRYQDLQQIIKAGRRATEVTKQLLAFSRRQVFQPRVVDLNSIVLGICPMLAALLGADVELTPMLADDLGAVLADRGQIEQVVMNLAVNARDAMPDGGILTIETKNADLVAPGDTMTTPHVLLEVRDTGTGIDQATSVRIFEPFFTTKKTGKGTGLGLATVFGIVQQSGGTILVDSALGRGSSFRVYLPRTDQPPSRSSAPVKLSIARGSETVLLVDDEEQIRNVAAAVLRRHGYQVLEAANGTEALRVASDHVDAIHLLVTDVVMPKMGGRKLVEELGARRPTMKILFASGYNHDALVDRGVAAAGSGFLQKPFTLDSLLHKVRELLDQREPR